MRVRKELLFTAALLGLATAFFVVTLPRPPLMGSKLMWFVEPTHYLMILGWPIIPLSTFGPLLALPLMVALVVGIGALFIWFWRRPHLSAWLYGAIFAWITIGTFLVWAEIVASI